MRVHDAAPGAAAAGYYYYTTNPLIREQLGFKPVEPDLNPGLVLPNTPFVPNCGGWSCRVFADRIVHVHGAPHIKHLGCYQSNSIPANAPVTKVSSVGACAQLAKKAGQKAFAVKDFTECVMIPDTTTVMTTKSTACDARHRLACDCHTQASLQRRDRSKSAVQSVRSSVKDEGQQKKVTEEAIHPPGPRDANHR
jgi:hypothetical protein